MRRTFAEKSADLLAAVTSVDENAKYIGGSFTTDVNDKDYDLVRKMYANVGVTEFMTFLE